MAQKPYQRWMGKGMLAVIIILGVIPLLLGLTRMRLFTFFWVSQIGMLAGTIVYVNAGKELARIDALAGILSPGVLIFFALLGLFPLSVKKLLALYKKRFRELDFSGA